MTIEEIKELIQLFTESGVGELEVQRGDNRVRIRRAGTNQEIVLPAIPAGAVGMPVGPMNSAGQSAGPAVAAAPALARAPEDEAVLVKSPIVGTFYEAPAPGARPFVMPGDTVEPGQVLCIIESMKLMNEIEAEVAGMIVAKLVENGKPVEYGEALFTVRPR